MIFHKYCELSVIMPRNQLTKDEAIVQILKLKNKLNYEDRSSDAKDLTNYYLNLLIDKIQEYAR